MVKGASPGPIGRPPHACPRPVRNGCEPGTSGLIFRRLDDNVCGRAAGPGLDRRSGRGLMRIRKPAAGSRGRRHWGAGMKLVIAIIKPFKLEDVRDALTGLGINGMTVAEVKGYGRQKGHTEIYRGAEYAVNFLPKMKIEVAVPSDRIDKVDDARAAAAKTGQTGDGKIFVTDISHAIRIRTGETDTDAL